MHDFILLFKFLLFIRYAQLREVYAGFWSIEVLYFTTVFLLKEQYNNHYFAKHHWLIGFCIFLVFFFLATNLFANTHKHKYEGKENL